MLNTLHKFREAVNLRLYGSKERVANVFNLLSALVSIMVLSSLVYYYGYPEERVRKDVVVVLVNASLSFYVLKYFLGYVYSFQPMTYFRKSRWEGLAIGLIVINSLSILLFNINLLIWFGKVFDFPWFNDFIIGFLQIYLLVLVGMEVGKSTTIFNRINIPPPAVFTLSLLFLISVGTGLLMLPEMTTDGNGAAFFDALFTSISASCITGLIVVDTGTFFSLKGQVVILMLVQLGGLNIIAFATLLAYFARNGIGLRFQSVLQSSMTANNPESTDRVFRQVMLFVFTFEFIGFFMVYFSTQSVDFSSQAEHIYFSIFHAISAFNNAGFALMPESLATEGFSGLYGLHWMVGILIFAGSFGFSNIGDILGVWWHRRKKNRPLRKLRIDTRISIYAAIALFSSAFFLIFLLEFDGLLAGKDAIGKLTASFLQAVTLRSAGFNSIDIGSVSTALVVAFIFYMFVGGSPGSMGAGIKTNTFVLLLVSGYSIIRGKPRLELFKSTISTDLLQRALAIFLFSLSLITFGIFLLTIFEPNIPFVDLMFEEVSAFCNVGLSRGITAELSAPARIVIMVSIFVGRMGALTLAFALLKPKKYKNYKYPSAHITVG
ncbi:MAG: hypothetical protein JJU02_01150 [Cryomorphaceae bacterium]|nr:hypothetical protein [Cryomorphaceae bacterium]